MGNCFYLAAVGDGFDGVFLCCPFSFDVFDEIWTKLNQFLKIFLPTFAFNRKLCHSMSKTIDTETNLFTQISCN